MKTPFLILTLAILSNFHTVCSQKTDSVKVRIQFKGVDTKWYGKNVKIGFWKSNDHYFPKQGTNDFGHTFKLNASRNSIDVELTFGEYAISAFIDVNRDGALNSNFFGKPTEPYCFSKGFKPKLSAPEYQDCAILINGSSTIELQFID